MQDSARIQAVIELLGAYKQQLGSRAKPVDAIVASYYRTRRYIGAKDRVAITDLFYYCVRNLRALTWVSGHDCSAFMERNVVISAICHSKRYNIRHIPIYFDGGRYAPAPFNREERLLYQRWNDKEPLAKAPKVIRANLPDMAQPMLEANFGDAWEEVADALNQQAPVDIRVNRLKCKDPVQIQKRLAQQAIDVVPIKGLVHGLRSEARFAAHATNAFKEGLYEMQDAGSQLLAMCVAAKPGDKVIDFCAGAGGKTLAIAGQMKNKGRIFALDVAENRLKQLKQRLARAGVDNVMTRLLDSERDAWLKRHRETADWVLVDAPCSGSGTWRRNPDLKWRFNHKDLNDIIDLQARIITSAAKLVKPGGRLVYATCSIYREENHAQVADFLEKNSRFRLAAPTKVWDKQANIYLSDDGFTQISPHKDGMDGFFVAQLLHGSTE